MTQHRSEFLRPPRQRLDQYRAPDAHPMGGQERLRRGTVFLDETNSGKWKRRRVIETIGDPQALESLHARRQHAFTASLIRRKIAALDDHDGEALFRRNNCNGKPRRSTADYNEIPYLARGSRCVARGESASHWASPLQQNQLAAEAGSHR